MNIFIKLSVVVIAITVVHGDDGPPYQHEHDDFWTNCMLEDRSVRDLCGLEDFKVTKNSEEGGYTTAKAVDHYWNGDSYRCSDYPKKVRFFCSKKYTTAYWAGTAPICGTRDDQEENCKNKGYKPTRFTSEYGDGEQCSLRGTKLLCAKE